MKRRDVVKRKRKRKRKRNRGRKEKKRDGKERMRSYGSVERDDKGKKNENRDKRESKRNMDNFHNFFHKCSRKTFSKSISQKSPQKPIIKD